jgi:hypothetical protein
MKKQFSQKETKTVIQKLDHATDILATLLHAALPAELDLQILEAQVHVLSAQHQLENEAANVQATVQEITC